MKRWIVPSLMFAVGFVLARGFGGVTVADARAAPPAPCYDYESWTLTLVESVSDGDDPVQEWSDQARLSSDAEGSDVRFTSDAINFDAGAL